MQRKKYTPRNLFIKFVLFCAKCLVNYAISIILLFSPTKPVERSENLPLLATLTRVVITHNACLTAQKMKFSIKDFFSKCDQIRRKLLKKAGMENLIFCAVLKTFIGRYVFNSNRKAFNYILSKVLRFSSACMHYTIPIKINFVKFRHST